AAVVGATRGMGRAVVRLLAERGDAVALLGRDASELETSARDLSARGARGTIATGHLDLAEPTEFSAALDRADQALGGLDTLVVTAGGFPPPDAPQRDPGGPGRPPPLHLPPTPPLRPPPPEPLPARRGGPRRAPPSLARRP